MTDRTVDFEMINPPGVQDIPEAKVRIPIRKTVFTVIFILSLFVGLGYLAAKHVDTDVFAQMTSTEKTGHSVGKTASVGSPVKTSKKTTAAPSKPTRRKIVVGKDKATGIVIMGNVHQDENGNWRLN